MSLLLLFQVSEDEVIASECELQDISVTPLLNALHAHKTVATIDLSHNMLGSYICLKPIHWNDFQMQSFLISLLLQQTPVIWSSIWILRNQLSCHFWVNIIFSVYRKWDNGETSASIHIIIAKIRWIGFGFALQSVRSNCFVPG